MFEVYNASRTTRHGYLGNDRRTGVTGLNAIDARNFASSGALVCELPTCKSGLVFVGPSRERRAHWRHENLSGEAACAIMDGRESEGAWHLRVKNEFFGPHGEFEKSLQSSLGLARLDVYVNLNSGAHPSARKHFAIEVQHSNISYQDAKQRVEKHRAAGLDGTIWMIDATSAKIHSEDLEWLASTPENHPIGRGNLMSRRSQRVGQTGKPAAGGVLVEDPSFASLLKLSSEITAKDYHCVVLIVAENSSGELIARRVLEGHPVSHKTRSGFLVRAFSKSLIPAPKLRFWASGKNPGTSLIKGVRESGQEVNNEVYILGPDIIEISLKSDHGSFVTKGGFQRRPKGWACSCHECLSRIIDGLKGLHAIGLFGPPDAKALAHLGARFNDPFLLRHINLLNGGVWSGVQLPDPRIWDHDAILPRYGSWLEDLDSQLRSNGWPGSYNDHQDFIWDFEDEQSFNMALDKSN